MDFLEINQSLLSVRAHEIRAIPQSQHGCKISAEIRDRTNQEPTTPQDHVTPGLVLAVLVMRVDRGDK